MNLAKAPLLENGEHLPAHGQDRSTTGLYLTLAVIGAWMLLYWPTLGWLVTTWGQDEYYKHGPLVPVISAYLIWQKRVELAAAWKSRSVESSGSAGILLLGLALYFMGALVGVKFVQALSLPFVLLGIVLYLAGRRAARLLQFPLLYLVAAVPLSYVLAAALTVPMETLAANIATTCLGLVGLPIHQVGVNLSTPRYSFLVAAPCSGLKTAITLLTLAILVAHLAPGLSVPRRWLLTALSIPAALMANAVRVMLIVLIGNEWGIKVAEGFLHGASGIVMFSLALGTLLGVGRLLSEASPEGDSEALHGDSDGVSRSVPLHPPQTNGGGQI